jgi:predicted PurR-regulated permease PerM
VILYLRTEGGLAGLLTKMAEIIENSRELLPLWAAAWLPQGDGSVIRAGMVEWLRTHAAELRKVGGDAGRALLHFIIGLVIGSFIALREARTHQTLAPLAQAMCERMYRLGEAFRRVVFAQMRISALNALLTGIYLLGVLPAFGVHLPFTKTMIVVTFLVGLLPVLGNLVSNTVIVVISLSHSLHAAAASLAFLVVIHKLEYFVNARIIGGQIQARAWELLIAMLVMEAAFGLQGVIAAPIIYAYIKKELFDRELI